MLCTSSMASFRHSGLESGESFGLMRCSRLCFRALDSGSGFHIVNILLNAALWPGFVPAMTFEFSAQDVFKACSLLLSLFGLHLGLRLDWAVLLGALFLAHPIHTESATWADLG